MGELTSPYTTEADMESEDESRTSMNQEAKEGNEVDEVDQIYQWIRPELMDLTSSTMVHMVQTLGQRKGRSSG